MTSDIEIARAARLRPIQEIAAGLGLGPADIDLYGDTKAKIRTPAIERLREQPDGKLVLVTAMTPTPAGEGKSTTTVGLGDAFRKLGKRAIVAIREPSLGPCFGMKGGAAGGGYAQVVPMEDINLHFTGDFHAITAAQNLLLRPCSTNTIFRQSARDRCAALGLEARARHERPRAAQRRARPRRPARRAPHSGFEITVASRSWPSSVCRESSRDLTTRLRAYSWRRRRRAHGDGRDSRWSAP